ncbi:MAG: hypothetical protein OEZ25_08955 [Candidatus Bathyarchaeota archaeon]|nr:hypothetical protein [Candidatus Bathyarchaeota archaeon]
MVKSTNVAEVHHNHYGNYKKLHSTSPSPEPQTSPKALKYQKVHSSGQVPMKSEKRQFGT